ncbi:MAG: glycerophosphodiester phosphodiesterase [Gammaproteobacteria bacterium]|nr:glycerophosphodiester phosphodiesterase [Gammaproteobacteria bacterium]
MQTIGRPLVIAHRGASGYLPEHTLVAKALAFGQGADYLEQDVVATRDDQLIVFHDLTLEQTTDVARHFPGRQRADGHYYCRDFNLAELRRLGVGPRLDPQGGERHPGRFPGTGGRFGIPTLAEEIRFIQGLVRSSGRMVGIYPEVKDPAWHHDEGIDLGMNLLDTLEACQQQGPRLPVFLQCFDAGELQRLRPHCDPGLPFVQLLDSAGGRPSVARLGEIASYAQAIGPSLKLLLHPAGDGQAAGSLVADAHRAGLAVHPYTFRRDELPAGVESFEALLETCLVAWGADGLFTDFPDLARSFIDQRLGG